MARRCASRAAAALLLLAFAGYLSTPAFVPPSAAAPREAPLAAAALGVSALLAEASPAFARGMQSTMEGIYDATSEPAPAPETILFNVFLFGGLVAVCLPILRQGLLKN